MPSALWAEQEPLESHWDGGGSGWRLNEVRGMSNSFVSLFLTYFRNGATQLKCNGGASQGRAGQQDLGCFTPCG